MQNFVPSVAVENDIITVTIRKEIPVLEAPVQFSEIDKIAANQAVYTLIQMRVEHCESQLAKAVANDKAKANPSGQYVYFEGGGHFSMPVYEQLVGFLNNPFRLFIESDPGFLRKAIAQQALRMLFLIWKDEEKIAKLNFDPELLMNMLTEELLVL